MEIKIENAEVSVRKKIHDSGTIFGMKKWAGKDVIIVVLNDGDENNE